MEAKKIDLNGNNGRPDMCNNEPLTGFTDRKNSGKFNLLSFEKISVGDRIGEWHKNAQDELAEAKRGDASRFPKFHGEVESAMELPRGKYPKNARIYEIQLVKV